MGERLVTIIDMCQKWGAVPLFVGDGSPSNTMWPGLRSTYTCKFHLDPSNPLASTSTLHTDRKDRTTDRPMA